MGTSLLVSEHEYLTTSYEPDCEYDEGVLLERNAGEQPHGITQTALAAFLCERRKRLGIRVIAEDRMSRVRKKIDEYLVFGVANVWLIGPEMRHADVYTPSS